MEAWYKEIAGADDREQVLAADYSPHADFLASLRGSILDVGGGAGLTARFLRADANYVVVDPLSLWNSLEWRDFGAAFRAGGPSPRFVDAEGENLPFGDDSFDAVLSLWSLNHVRNARACVAEMVRVLKAGGVGRIVLEDTEPRWSDLLRDGAGRLAARLTKRPYRARISCPLIKGFRMKLTGSWEVAEDHIAVRERDVLAWLAAGTRVERRQWLAGYLTIDFIKPAALVG